MENIVKIPAITTDQMREVDRLMVEEYKIQLIQMMENAGANLARLALERYSQRIDDLNIVVLCGLGNNGGGGLVATRHLHNRGAPVSVCLVGNEISLKGIPRLQWQILKNLGIPEGRMENIEGAGLLVDCLIGYGLRGDPRAPLSDWIQAANRSKVPVLALDVPSGLDATSGIPGEPCIRADATLTLALPKKGLLMMSAKRFVGDLFVGDISVPSELYDRMGIKVRNIFYGNPIIQVGRENHLNGY